MGSGARQIFQSFWHGAQLSPYERLCIKSFLDHGHEYHLFTYGEIENAPSGCQLLDAGDILPREQVFAYKEGGSFSAFSNWFRYKLLELRGNWWVDTDVVCISDDWPTEPRQVGYESATIVNGAVIRAGVGDPLMQQAFEIAQAQGQEIKWGTIGPKLITQLIESGQYDYKVWGIETFYPIPYDGYIRFLFPEFTSIERLRARGAVCIHLWNEMLRIHKIGKQAAPPPHSLLAKLFERYGLLDEFSQQYLYNAAEWKLEGPFPRAKITPELVGVMLQMAIAAANDHKGPSHD